jgi:hypothetical protein
MCSRSGTNTLEVGSADKAIAPDAFRDTISQINSSPSSSLRDSPPSRNRQNGCASTIIDYFAA